MNLYLVTGTTKGLGQALAAHIGEDRASFLVTFSRGPSAKRARRVDIGVDLADARALERAGDRLERAIAGREFDKAVLINNAGVVSPVGSLDDNDAAELERSIAVNVTAPLLLMRRFLRATASVPVRRIINISSGAGRRPISGWAAYCAGKAALDMASRVAALDARTHGQHVHVVSLAPGVIDTAMQAVVRSASPETFADVERFRKMKEEGTLRAPADVARDILVAEAAGKLDDKDAVLDLREMSA